VITGLIKANIPTRLSSRSAARSTAAPSSTSMGAEALLGMGDMLYMPSGTGLPIRVHGAFVSDDEVHRVVAYLKSQGEPNYIEGILEGGVLDGDSGEIAVERRRRPGNESDAMYDQAVAIVLQHKRASISLVQRHLRIGYNRAARLLEQMEKSGLVSSMAYQRQSRHHRPGTHRMKRDCVVRAAAWLACALFLPPHRWRPSADAVEALRVIRAGRQDRPRHLHADRHLARWGQDEDLEWQLRVRPARSASASTYTKPFEQLIVADGQKVWIHDVDLNQVSSRKFSQALGATPAALAGRW
jgi:hypothetical protein